MELVPIRRQNVSDGVFRQLLTQILEGRLEQLPSERDLAATLQVNRHAVREALKRLEQIGVVRIAHGGATEVPDLRETAGLDILAYLAGGPVERFGPSLVRSVFEFRHAIGSDAARLAARRADTSMIDRLRVAAGEYRAPLPRAEQVLVDRAFWSLLIDASDNIAYRFAFNTLIKAFDQLPELLPTLLAPEIDDPSGHEVLVQAIADSDSDSAAREAGRLLALGSSAAEKLLAALPVTPQTLPAERA
ncbi:GntR family transcriptional regulator [Nocardia xishanensis]|uniref:FadR/GntR family transcriptional regulator n=1 Tax=Nocardia xishanensis TaxID=238964 RepID=A0ABW7WZI6_9NOCA